MLYQVIFQGHLIVIIEVDNAFVWYERRFILEQCLIEIVRIELLFEHSLRYWTTDLLAMTWIVQTDRLLDLLCGSLSLQLLDFHQHKITIALIYRLGHFLFFISRWRSNANFFFWRFLHNRVKIKIGVVAPLMPPFCTNHIHEPYLILSLIRTISTTTSFKLGVFESFRSP